jgi:hypothetical protein
LTSMQVWFTQERRGTRYSQWSMSLGNCMSVQVCGVYNYKLYTWSFCKTEVVLQQLLVSLKSDVIF